MLTNRSYKLKYISAVQYSWNILTTIKFCTEHVDKKSINVYIYVMPVHVAHARNFQDVKKFYCSTIYLNDENFGKTQFTVIPLKTWHSGFLNNCFRNEFLDVEFFE